MEQIELFTEALKIEDPWYIESIVFNEDLNRLDININFKKGSLFEYEEEDTHIKTYHKAYDTRQKSWRHLNFFEYHCYLNVRVPRIKHSQKGITMIFPPFSGRLYGFTLMFEAYVLQLVKHMPVKHVSQLLGTYDKKIWLLLECYVFQGQMQDDYQHITCLGMDETSVAKGHDYVTLFVELNKRRTIQVVDGKSHKGVEEFVEVFKGMQGDPLKVTDFSCDMSPAFIKGIKEQFVNAHITFDRFHVTKLIQEALDSVRRSEVKTQPALKKSRFALLKNPEKLTAGQRQKRAYISSLNLKTSRALRMKEAFQGIYQSETVEIFKEKLNEWYQWIARSKLKPFVDLSKTIKKHMNGILQWKQSQINNGILEALNSIIQAAKRKARGYRPKHFKLMALFLTGKLNLKKVNPYLHTAFS